jgi:hydrogenase nickel incorporation protein HypA/HybF
MHELGLARNIVAIVAEHAAGRRVRRVRLAIGPLACVERPALEFCWELVTEKTTLEGAGLEMVDAEGDTFLIREYEVKEAA